ALIQIYWQDTLLAGLPQAWSLNTELTFYLFLPVWATALRHVGRSRQNVLRAQYVGCVVLYLGALGFRAWLRWDGRDLGYTWLPAHFDAFALGMAMAVASAAGAARRSAGDKRWRADGAPGVIGQLADRPALALGGAVFAYGGVVALDMPIGFDSPTVVQEVAHQVLFGLVALLVVLPGAFGDARGWWRRLLASRPLHGLGVVSYGLYLWHITTLYEIDRRWWPEGPTASASVVTTLWLALWATVAATLVALASWWVVERPLVEQARRFRLGGRRLDGPPSDTSQR
ncbi:MAG: acyltransferase family protein, partial [Aquihabitans sp.]